jgi:hypothetical protein
LKTLRLSFFGQLVSVACMDAESAVLLEAVYGSFSAPDGPGAAEPALDYSVERDAEGGFVLRRDPGQTVHAPSDGLFLFHFEKDLTIELQRRRSDLYFLHAAALERDGRGLLLVAESGAGKSTTTWGLLHHGFRYASDELAPIDLARREVHGFPHALCLKTDPPEPYPLPAGTLRTSRTRHVPVNLMPSPLAPGPFAPETIVFVQYRPELGRPALAPLGRAEAAARLYVQALNALAHPEDGLDAALEIVRGARCFSLEAVALDATCALVVGSLTR